MAVKLSDSNFKPGSGPYYPHGEHCLFHDEREAAEFWDYACCKNCQHRFRTAAELGDEPLRRVVDKCPLCGVVAIRVVWNGSVKLADV